MADNLDTPYSRREIFYKGILDQDPDSLPDPETREERYLKAIAEAYPTPVEATVTQDEGSSMTSVMSQKAVTDALDGLRDSKLDKTGTAPLADNLTPYSADSGATQTTPFIAQGTGCGNGENIVDTGSYAQIKKKLGNTVCVNQIVYTNADWASSDNGRGTLTDNVWKVFPTSNTKAYAAAKASATMVYYPRHTYLFHYRVLEMSPGVTSAGFGFNSLITSLNSPGDKYFIIDLDRDRTVVQAVISGSSNLETTEYANFTEPYCIDLDVWFGGHDNIPAHLLSHPEDWGKYYSGSLATTPGQLVNADGSVLTSIGRNCNSGDGDVLAIPNQAYYCKGTATITYKDRNGSTISTASVTNTSFTTPADCFSFGVSGTGVTISLYYSGESGYDEDYDYSVLAEVDTGSEVLRSTGAVADEKTPDGTITRNVGEPVTLDLSAMTFTQEGAGGTAQWYSSTQPFASYKIPATNAERANARSSRLIVYSYTALATQSGGFAITSTGRLAISNDVYTNRASYGSITFYCEAATPTTEQGTPFSGASADNFAIDDFGSMYWTQSAGVPQGVEIFYPYDYKAAVDTLLNMVDGDVEKLVTETELGAVADRIPEAPAEDGTYTLKATVADGVKIYSWVADE